MKKTICVDLDGVLAKYEQWEGVENIGDPIPGAVEFTQKLAKFAKVVIHSSRCNLNANLGYTTQRLVEIVRTWLDKHGFAYDEIYAGVGKPLAAAYVDDRAVGCRPEKYQGEFEWSLHLCQHLCQ